jgi:hypothetical protein
MRVAMEPDWPCPCGSTRFYVVGLDGDRFSRQQQLKCCECGWRWDKTYMAKVLDQEFFEEAEED